MNILQPPAIFGLYGLPLIRMALTIRKSLAATAHTSFPHGIFSFCFFKIHFVNCLECKLPLVAWLITIPAPCTIRDLMVLSPGGWFSLSSRYDQLPCFSELSRNRQEVFRMFEPLDVPHSALRRQLQIVPSPGTVWISWQALSFFANSSKIFVTLFKSFWTAWACATIPTSAVLNSAGKAAWFSIISFNLAFPEIPLEMLNPHTWQIPLKTPWFAYTASHIVPARLLSWRT